MKERIRDTISEFNGMLWPKKDGDSGELDIPKYVGEMGRDKDTPKRLSEYIANHRVVIHAGACCGWFASQYADLFSVVYAIEPVPENFYCLCHNADKENVVKLQACLGAKPGLARMGKYLPDIGSWHILPENAGIGAIPIITIDMLSAPACDLIHLDIEGYEYDALVGAEQTILKFRPAIAIEIESTWLKRYNKAPIDLDSLLVGKYGYVYAEKKLNDHVFIPKEWVK